MDGGLSIEDGGCSWPLTNYRFVEVEASFRRALNSGSILVTRRQTLEEGRRWGTDALWSIN